MTIYDHELRVLACLECGAPLRARISGGLVGCTYCGATHELAPRVERAITSDRTLGESERVARLREQAGSAEPEPPSIAELLTSGHLPAERADDARASWRAARRALVAHGEFGESERLFHLTRVLLPHCDDATRRAVLETALDLLTDDRHRHVLRCELAMGAARIGELEAADAWLEHVDRRPVDLLMDSAVRAALATVATVRDRPAEVLAVLGRISSDLPVSGPYADTIELLRIHALERSDAGEEALAAHRAFFVDAAQLERTARAQDPLVLAPRTWFRRHRVEAAERLSRVEARVADAARERQDGVAGLLLGAILFGMLIGCVYTSLAWGWLTAADFQTRREGDACVPGGLMFVSFLPITLIARGAKKILKNPPGVHLRELEAAREQCRRLAQRES